MTLDVRFTDRQKELLGRRWVKWLARKGIPKDYGWWLNWIRSKSKNPAAGAIALRDLCTLADRHGRIIRLDVLHADPKLIRLYKKFGFKLIGKPNPGKPCCGNPNPANEPPTTTAYRYGVKARRGARAVHAMQHVRRNLRM